MTISRRYFLKGLAASASAALIGQSLLVRSAHAATQSASVSAEGAWRTAGSHWGAMQALVKGGVVEEIKPFARDQYPTDMLNGIKGLIYNPSRIRYPMARLDWLKKREHSDRTQRGDNRFVRLTWDEALDLFYEELERVQTSYGPSGLYAGATGWRQTGQFHSCGSHMQRGVNLHGNFVDKVGDYSTGAGQVILPYVMGSTEVYDQGTSWPLILEHSDTIVLWANDLYKNLQVGWNCETHGSYEYLAKLKEHIAAGKIKVISVDPVQSKTQQYLGCEQQYINPQSDVAFMLALAHTLYTENLHDEGFLNTYTLGFEPFIEYVLGKGEDKIEKTPEWATPICGVTPERTREFARLLASGRTQLIFGWAIQRQQHGEQPYWAGAVLAAMLGQIGLPGGGISYAHHYSGIGIPPTGASVPGGFPRNLEPGKLPEHPSTDFKGASPIIPVARWIDCILEPGGKLQYNGGEVTYPDIKMCIFSGCNPWHHHQDHNRMKRAFYELETVVTIDYSWNATCRFSDLVLPACTQFERNDIDVYGGYSKTGILAMHKLVDPLFHSRTDFDIFTDLCRRYGRHKEYTQNKDEFQWLRELYNDCRKANEGSYPMPDFDKFWADGYVHFGEGKNWVRHASFREDPEVNAVGTPSGFIEISSRKIGSYGYDDCQQHPMWLEKTERSHGGPGSDQYPLWLQSVHPDKRLHSQMCESDEYRATYAVQGREPVYLSPADAKQRGINDGDLVRVFNDRGQLLAGAVVSDLFPVGVIRIQEGAWYGPTDASIGALDTYGDPNTLTLDVGTSRLAQAPSANTCLVEIEVFTGTVPPVTSFGGPTLVNA